MAIRREVTCINKTDRSNAHERIRSIGGSGWKETQPDAIRQIEAKTHEYWTKGGGRTADVVIATHNGNKYLRTTNDGVQPDNLLALPECR